MDEKLLAFLIEVLKLISEDSSQEIMYSFLSTNQKKLIPRLAEVLRKYAEATLPKLEHFKAYAEACVINKFGNLVKDFPLGSKMSNLEIAIVAFTSTLTIFTRELELTH